MTTRYSCLRCPGVALATQAQFTSHLALAHQVPFWQLTWDTPEYYRVDGRMEAGAIATRNGEPIACWEWAEDVADA